VPRRWPIGPTAFLGLVLGSPCLTSCQHIGPITIAQDRLPYNEALADTWKEQTLLNIVKLRYGDTPVFVEVAQIVSGYNRIRSLGSDVSASVIPNAIPSVLDPLLAGFSTTHSFSDQPTISYSPQTNAKFIQNLTLPLPPSSVLFLIQTGYPVDVVFDLLVESINGLHGRIVSGNQILAATPEFLRVSETLRKAQLTGHMGMRVELDKDKKESLLLFFTDAQIEPGLEQDLREARQLLRLDPGQREYRVVFGATSSGPNELAILTRSAYRILISLASYVQVPEPHTREGRAVAYKEHDEPDHRRFTVWSGCDKPKDCLSAIRYRGYWFWIDDCDLESKRTMLFLMIMLALADTGSQQAVPFLTISTSR
jgi:hypothetical protein